MTAKGLDSPLLVPVVLQARVEGNPANMSQFRVTLASPAPQLSQQLKELIVQQLRTDAA